MLDDLIDDVAREMTAGEASGALTARVVGSIDREQTHSRAVHRRRLSWAAAPVALAVVLTVVAAVWWRVSMRPTPVPGVGLQTRAINTPKAGETPVQMPPRSAMAKPGVTATRQINATGRFARRIGPRGDVVGPEADATREPGFESLAPSPLDVAPMRLVPLTDSGPIEIGVIAIEPIDVAALPREEFSR